MFNQFTTKELQIKLAEAIRTINGHAERELKYELHRRANNLPEPKYQIGR